MPCNPIALARRWGAVCGIAGIAIAAGIVSAYSEIPSLLITPEVEPHSKIFAESSYPTAATCGQCHTQIYKEWSNSSHAYASISPMFHKFEQTINDLASGTVRAFCVRCHQQVGTQRGEPRYQALWERSEVSREGITCITCHRITDEFAKVNGQRTVQPGNISRAVTTTGKGSKFYDILKNREQYHITTNEKEHGTQIHTSIFTLDQLDKPQFCVSCHQVAVQPGIKLEVVWDQYRASPAAEQGITCQDCHMGRVPGIAAGFHARTERGGRRQGDQSEPRTSQP